MMIGTERSWWSVQDPGWRLPRPRSRRISAPEAMRSSSSSSITKNFISHFFHHKITIIIFFRDKNSKIFRDLIEHRSCRQDTKATIVDSTSGISVRLQSFRVSEPPYITARLPLRASRVFVGSPPLLTCEEASLVIIRRFSAYGLPRGFSPDRIIRPTWNVGQLAFI